jgi:predicted enzyme related to lactoylglutathione lyase
MNSSNTINYFEIPASSSADDTKQLREFYSSMFKWKFEEGKDTDDYWYTENAGIKGAILKKRDNRQNATFYIEVESVDDCISKAKDSKANVVLDKQEISEGFYALLEDPHRNIIGIWEPKK